MNIPTLPRPVLTEHWTLDPERTTIEFSIRNFWGIATVRGRFTRFDGSGVVDADGPKVRLTIDAASIDTGNASRDEHLRSYDFFDVVSSPHIEFISTGVDRVDEQTFAVAGDLSAAGTTVPITFHASVDEAGDGLEVTATATVDPRAFDMSRGPLWSIRPPATVSVTAHIVRRDGGIG